MIIDILKHTIVNVCKSVTYGMKKPDSKFFRCCLESMLQYRTPVLSHLRSGYFPGERDAKYALKYFSRNLGKKIWEDLPTYVNQRVQKFVGTLTPDTCFCFDSVDLNKYSAEKMEGLSKVRDGSTGSIVNGYVINAVSVNGIPLLMEREILEKSDEGVTTRFDIFSDQIARIIRDF